MSLTKESAIDIIWHVINKSLMWRKSSCSKHVYLRYMQLESDRTRPKNSLPFCTLAWTPGCCTCNDHAFESWETQVSNRIKGL